MINLWRSKRIREENNVKEKLPTKTSEKNQIYTVCSGLSGICTADHLGNSKGNGAQ